MLNCAVDRFGAHTNFSELLEFGDGHREIAHVWSYWSIKKQKIIGEKCSPFLWPYIIHPLPFQPPAVLPFNIISLYICNSRWWKIRPWIKKILATTATTSLLHVSMICHAHKTFWVNDFNSDRDESNWTNPIRSTSDTYTTDIISNNCCHAKRKKLKYIILFEMDDMLVNMCIMKKMLSKMCVWLRA